MFRYKKIFFIVLNTLFFSQFLSATDYDIRYDVIKKILNKYQRPFTLLDMGAELGIYSLKTAHDYPDAVCVMVEANSSSKPTIANQLFENCIKNNNLTNIIFLNKMFSQQEIQHLSECEKFDVVLAMNFLERFGDYWQAPLESLLNMADHLIIEIKNKPFNLHSAAIQKYILEKSSQIISENQTVDSYIYVVCTGDKNLQRKTWLWKKIKETDYTIHSSFAEKKLIKQAYWPPNTQQITQWIPGINLLTFKMCNGVYPTSQTIKQSLYNIKDVSHTDWMINNMILQGNKIAWIDLQDSMRQPGGIGKPSRFSKKLFQNHNILIDMNDPKKIEHFFWYTLIHEPTNLKRNISLFASLLSPKSIVFDINSYNKELFEIYLGLGATVFSFNLDDNSIKDLEHETIFSISQQTLKSFIANITIDNIVKLYKNPNMCNIHANSQKAFELICTINKPIACVIFDFDMQYLNFLEKTLEYLNQLGYKRFNFSAREIPYLCLDHNPHNNIKKDWVNAFDLIDSIKEFASLEHESLPLYGKIYAQYA